MALNVFELFGKIAIDNSGAEREIDNTVKKAKSAESNLTKVFKKIGTVVAAAFTVDKIIDFGNACKDAYAEVAAEQSAFAQIMGDYTETAQDKLDAIASKTGAVSTRMTPYMTSLTAKFKGLGYGIEEATDLASSGLTIAADAAAFWDMSLDESMSHLNSFINGSYEGGEAIGLFANDTQMAMYAIEKGLVKTTAEWSKLDEATKQATRLEYAENMMEMSGATGQAAKEAGSLANVQANLTERWRQFLAVIGEPIVEKIVIPAMQTLSDIMPKVTDATAKGIEWITSAFSSVKDAVKNLPETLKSAGQTISDTWKNTVWPAIQGMLKIAFGIELPEWGDLKSAVVNWWESDNGIKQGIASVCNWVLNLFGAPANVTAKDVSNVLSSWWTSAKALVQNACDWVLKLFSEPEKLTADKAKAILSNWWTSAKNHVMNACDWILKQFGAPDDLTANDVRTILGTWWTSAKTHVENACLWVLKQFGAPDDLTADKAKTILSDWWTTAKTHVANACDWALQMFKEPKIPTSAEVETILKTWWNTAKGFVQTACKWVLNPFGAPDEVTGLQVEKILQPWWLKAVGLVKDACTWALNFFGAPDDLTQENSDGILGTWWGKALTLVQDTCSWVLKLFGAPSDLTDSDVENIIGTWWDNGVSLIEDACAWVLNLFGEPKALSAETVEDILGTWWTSAKALVQNACDWVLQLFTNPTESQQTILEHIGVWWESIGNVIAGACSWVLKLFNVPEESAEDIKLIIQNWWDGIKNAFKDICGVFFRLFTSDTDEDGKSYTTVLTEWFNGILTALGDVFKVSVGIATESLNFVGQTIATWWNGIKSTLYATATVEYGSGVHTSSSGEQHGDAFRKFPDSTSSTSTTSTSGGFFSDAFSAIKNAVSSLPGFATGLDYVPRDNYLARLHQGEAVLTRNEADAWRSGGDTSRVESMLANVSNLLQVIAQNTGAGNDIVLDTGALVGHLAPGMDAQLGSISSRKGRRN